MIFTIGHKESYERNHKEYGDVVKVGKCAPCKQYPDGYEGGYAFLTTEDAQRRIDEAYPDRGFAVFGLDADWEADTEPNKDGGWWHNLIRDVDIIFLNE